MKKTKCSLIITTYNWHKALELVLLSVLKQSVLPNEIIIADDGSDERTKNLIENFQQKSPVPIIHSWQKDKGFRAAKSRNKAIAKSSYEYIVIIDGDIILHKDFIADHIKNAKKDCFIQGSRVLIEEEKTKLLLNNKIINIGFFSKNINNRKNTINNNFLSKIFSKINKKTSGIKTCNMSFWKKDVLKTNGFNEDFIGWGREDSEFVARLYNNNIKCNNVKFNCNCYHLYHNENTRESLVINDKILKKTIDNNLKFCSNGVDQYL
jgi:glycosyltransferase involved in cell wall biosynthesis